MKDIVKRRTTLPSKMSIVSKIKNKLRIRSSSVKRLQQPKKKEAKKKENLQAAQVNTTEKDAEKSEPQKKEDLTATQKRQDQDMEIDEHTKSDEKDAEMISLSDEEPGREHDSSKSEQSEAEASKEGDSAKSEDSEPEFTKEDDSTKPEQNDGEVNKEEDSRKSEQNDDSTKTQKSTQAKESEVQENKETEVRNEGQQDQMNEPKEEDNTKATNIAEKTAIDTAAASQMSEQVTESEALKMLENSEAVEEKLDEKCKIHQLTGGLKRMSVDAQGGSKSKARKADFDESENLLLDTGEDELLDDDASFVDEKLLDYHSEDNKGNDDESSSGASRSYLDLGGEGTYSTDEQDLGNDDTEIPEQENTAEVRQSVSQKGQALIESQQEVQRQTPKNGAAFAAHCFLPQGAFQNEPNEAVRIQTLIQPPGTNVKMQQVMKGRLPSTSSVSSDSHTVVVAQSGRPEVGGMALQLTQIMANVMESRLSAPSQRTSQMKTKSKLVPSQQKTFPPTERPSVLSPKGPECGSYGCKWSHKSATENS